jgi:TonB-dependent receptor
MRKTLLGVASPAALVVALAATAASAQSTEAVATVQTASQAAGPAGQANAQASTQVAANTPTTVTEVVVTGLRGSLQNSERIKQTTAGVVDAITAEDIGKFPDTNLAEAVQRIPGVTIDRDDGEGAHITVRGFGPEYNLVTLNGRSMPGSLDPNNITNGATRSFDFENISADGIAGVAVYKTGQADVPSGGIGSTVDITTARPFDYPGQTGTISVKGNYDTSSVVGSNVTPDVSGLYSNTFFDGKVGFLINGSYSVRDNREQTANIGGWLEDQICTPQLAASGTSPGCTTKTLTPGVTNNQTVGVHNYAPQSEAWGFNDYQRTRENGQAVLQFRPVENLTATVDYTYSLFDDVVNRHSYGAWFGYGGSLDTATINKHGTVTDIEDAGADLSYSTFDDHYRNEGGSGGLNIKWQPTSNLTVTYDGHHSYEDSGGGPNGNNDYLIVGVQQDFSQYKIFHLGSTTIPTTTWTYLPAGAPTGDPRAPTAPGLTLNTITPAYISPLFAEANNNVFDNAIDEQRLDVLWKNTADSGLFSILKSVKAGFQYKDFSTNARGYGSGLYGTGYYDPGSDGLIPSSVFTKVSSCSILKSFSGGGCQTAVPYFYTFNVPQAIPYTTAKYNYNFVVPSSPNNDDNIDETTFAGYLKGNVDTKIYGMRFKAQFGVRYEHTDVVAQSLQNQPTGVYWANPTEFFTEFSPNKTFSDVKPPGNDQLLPSIDTSLEVIHNVLLKASYSKTITRSDLNNMVGTEAVSTTPKPGARTVTEGNPGLLPYESQNFDTAVEWYYKKDSYLSINYFEKHVTNFLTQTTTTGTAFGLTDPSAGAIAQKATAQVVAQGLQPTPQNIFTQMVKDYPQGYPANPAVSSTVPPVFYGQPGDPLIEWDITEPSNANAVELHGIEFASQHVFGNTGFGYQANISLPEGGAGFNPLVIGSQFALPGLSKSYNLVGFWEKYGGQVRVAYTWRDKYLTALSQGQGPNEPVYVAAYGQLDMSASYNINPHLTVFFDGINLTSSNILQYGRYSEQFLLATEGAARLQLGIRAKF